ncbi:hypothetical protein IFM89_023059 [Coptis chinensis]|uniref:Uncharacterized protein n=1 Tax=Coptis chinensis TaxID=261450 RepID=A0A835MFQ8_9MAGN|nr:hypothetical protein IFM89_023059 [Coptis chinensis]
MKVHYKTMPPRFIMAEVMRGDFYISISYWIAWHARLKCLQDIHGDYGASYNMLPRAYMIKPIIGLDGCFMKREVWRAMLKHGGLGRKQWLVFVAIYITRSENKDSWMGF